MYMKRVFKYFLVATVGVMLLQACSKKDSPPSTPPIIIPDIPKDPDPSEVVIQAVDDDVNIFMSKYNIPGLSLAITRHGKLVYAKGYGMADKEKSEMVTTKSRFRFASLSKWVTSATIMRLIQQGRLSMDDKVFGTGGVLGTTFGSQPYQTYVTDITIEQLLHHTGGGWGNSSNDPMFAQPQLNGDDLLTWILNNRSLTNPPGTKFDYSNVGFFILSNVIQKITGKPYDTYVKDTILAPLGITDMEIGATTLSARKANEVKYYGTNPYGYADGVITRISGAGGWIGTATDLMRFLVHVDGFATVPDILDAATLSKMSSKTTASGNYGCGFILSSNGNWFHGGTYNGTFNRMVRTTTGYSWAVLINMGWKGDMGIDLDKLIWPAVEKSTTPWPNIDLF